MAHTQCPHQPIIQMSYCCYVALLVLGVAELLMTGGQTEKQDGALISATLNKKNKGINLMVLYAWWRLGDYGRGTGIIWIS